MLPERALRASALVGLLFTARLFVEPAAPVAERVVQLVDVPLPGWYEADDLGAAARAAGALSPAMTNGAIHDGDTVRLVNGWALPARDLPATATRVFGGRLSLNTASIAALEGLPGIGPALAARIAAGRPYRTVAELDDVKGIGPVKLAALTPHVLP